MSTFNLERQLLACGDVSSNPGTNRKSNPKTQYPCRECSKNIRQNQKAIVCDECEACFHAKCPHMCGYTLKHYVEHRDINWICTRCALLNFSESFFEDLHSEQSEQLIAESEDAPLTAIDHLKQLRDENRMKCTIANLNINSFPNKFEEISEWLSSKSVDILSIQETKID